MRLAAYCGRGWRWGSLPPMGRISLVVSAVLLSACGPELAPELEGSWAGVSTATFGSAQPVSAQAGIGTGVAGDVLAVAGVCPSGSHSLSLRGSGDRAEWAGTYACPAVTVGDCANARVTLTSATAELLANGSLRLSLGGTAQLCTGGGKFSLTFVGTRR